MSVCFSTYLCMHDAQPISKTPPLPSQPGRTAGRSSPRRSPTLCLQPPPPRRWSGWHTFRSASTTYWQRVSEAVHGRTASRSECECVGGGDISLDLWVPFAFFCTHTHAHAHTHTHTHTADKQPATEHAAVWVPDSDASVCMHCRKAKFTTINRRVSLWSCDQHSLSCDLWYVVM